MGGAAVTIALQQLKYVLGIRSFTKETDIVSVMESVWGSVRHGVLINLPLDFLISTVRTTWLLYLAADNKARFCAVELADSCDWLHVPCFSSACQVHCGCIFLFLFFFSSRRFCFVFILFVWEIVYIT